MKRKTIAVLVLAAIWSVGLIVAAAVAPAYSSESASSSSSAVSAAAQGLPTTIEQAQVTSSSSTLVEENGPGVLALVAIPLVMVAVVSLALRRRRVNERHGAGPLAWTAVALLGAFVLISILSIGIFVFPVLALLVFACAFEAMRPDPRLAPPAFSHS